MIVSLQYFDLETVEETGLRCCCCHELISPGCGMVFGRPCLHFPVKNAVCRRCVHIAAMLVGSEPTVSKEGSA